MVNERTGRDGKSGTTYRTTIDALWDVIGTISISFFYIIASIFAISLITISQSVIPAGNSSPLFSYVVGSLGIGILLVVAYRFYRIMIE